ncbi:MAG TPA: XylR family transcriptional regulator [Lacipirellulaceae bacterium]|nr:XylR family transcriptional regulator [Lacipirellulaceae bacterium]
MVQRPRVALLIDTATSWGSGLIAGIAQYAHTAADWQLFLGPRGKYDRLTLPSYWAGDGIIARVTHERLAQQIIRRAVPAVNVSWYRYGGDVIPQCTCDEQSVGDMAVKYFLDRGFRQFAYCASSLRNDYVDRLGATFIAGLKRRTYPCHVFQPATDPDGFLPSANEADRLIFWLHSLPKPIALLAFDCVQARQITDVCHIASIKVPQEVAVLGGEHDTLSCTISKPQLSSIDHSPEKVGWAAAELLNQLMQGQSPPQPVLLPASRVITRQSTDTVAVPDDLLAAAVEFIKANSARRIQVSDILAAVPISRRALEKGFRKMLGAAGYGRAIALRHIVADAADRQDVRFRSSGAADAGISSRAEDDADGVPASARPAVGQRPFSGPLARQRSCDTAPLVGDVVAGREQSA